MFENILKEFTDNWEHFEEKIFVKKIILDNRKIYPVHNVSYLFKKTGQISTIAISPLAWVIKENNSQIDDENEYYMILFDKNDMKHVKAIIEKFILEFSECTGHNS